VFATVATADATPFTADSGDMLARAETWLHASPVYDQDTCFRAEKGYARTDWNGVLGGCHAPYYRTDCSGFVSMVWDLPVSFATPREGLEHDLTDVARLITKEQLRTGDALLAWGKHVRLFEHWTDATRTSYVAYDFGSTPVKHQTYVWDGPGEYTYVPIRYDPAA
jgi:cell wall-associated NlpC family hydrolase